MADLATLEDLKGRLDWTLDADEERIATSALEDASDLARHYGSNGWTDATTAPRLVRTLVLKACKRYMQNPEGATQSRAGDETLGWSDDAGENAGTVYFTTHEIGLLRALAGTKPTIVSAQISAWDSKPRPTVGYVPDSYVGGKPFPLFADPVSPW